MDSNEIVKNFKNKFDNMSLEEQKAYLKQMGVNLNSINMRCNIVGIENAAAIRFVAIRRAARRRKRLNVSGIERILPNTRDGFRGTYKNSSKAKIVKYRGR